MFAALLLRLVRTAGMPAVWQLALSALPAEAAMVLGYFSFETLVLGETAAAAAAVHNNLLQAAAGIVLAVLLEQAVCRVPGLMRPSGKTVPKKISVFASFYRIRIGYNQGILWKRGSLTMKNETIRKLVLSAMFAALCCVATMIVQIPTVAGYTNLGECMCLLAGLVLGPWYGFFAAGIGSGLADLLAGYAHYVPGTFLIKGLVALIAALLLRPLLKKGEKIPFWRLAVIELPSEVVMVLGYFGYKALILGKGLSAAASIPNNLVQAAIGIVLSVLLYTALSKVPEIHKSFWKGE